MHKLLSLILIVVLYTTGQSNADPRTRGPSMFSADSLAAQNITQNGNETQTTKRGNSEGRSPPAKSKLTPDKDPTTPDTAVVVAEGVGTSADQALKDAFRNAVRQIVGAFVDSEIIIKNDQIISDKILAYSHGFVKTYKEISKTVDDGIFRVRIEARVESRRIMGKLKDATISVTNIDGRGIFSEVVTQEEARKHAKNLVDKSLERFPVSILRAEVNRKPTISQVGNGVQMQVTLRIEPDLGRYAAFVATFQPILDKIALTKGEFSLTATKEWKGKPKTKTKHANSYLIPFDSKLWVARMPNALERHRNLFIQAKAGQVVIALCTHRTAETDRTAWSYYSVDDSIRPSLIRLANHEYKAKCVFLSESDKTIAVAEQTATVPPFRHLGLICPWAGWQKDRINHNSGNTIGKEGLFLICPIFMNANTAFHIGQYYLPALDMPVNIRLSLDEVKAISKIECQLIK